MTRHEERQRYFNKVWDYFVVGNRGVWSRMYRADRTPNGMPCAVGLFIENDEYVYSMEGGLRKLMQHDFAFKKRIQRHIGFFKDLQNTHDTCADSWYDKRRAREEFVRFAARHKLEVPEEKVAL